jgi:hypothetical protein
MASNLTKGPEGYEIRGVVLLGRKVFHVKSPELIFPSVLSSQSPARSRTPGPHEASGVLLSASNLSRLIIGKERDAGANLFEATRPPSQAQGEWVIQSRR